MPDYKRGDKIVMTDESIYPITRAGAKGTIVKRNDETSDRYLVRFDPSTCGRSMYSDDYTYWVSAKYFRKDETMYKVGDAIIMTESANAVYGFTQQGAKGTIVSGPDRRGEYNVRFECSTLHNYGCDMSHAEFEVHPKHFTLNPAQPVFKKGDKVRVLRKRDNVFHVGDILTVDNPRIDSDGDITAEKADGDWGWIAATAVELVRGDSAQNAYAQIKVLQDEITRLNERIASDAGAMRTMYDDLTNARRDLETMSAAYEKLINAMTREQLIALVKNA